MISIAYVLCTAPNLLTTVPTWKLLVYVSCNVGLGIEISINVLSNSCYNPAVSPRSDPSILVPVVMDKSIDREEVARRRHISCEVSLDIVIAINISFDSLHDLWW